MLSSKETHIVYLALGTNLEDKNVNLLTAITNIAERIGVLSAISSVYESEPWGFDSKNSFLNMVVKVETTLSPIELLYTSQAIEKAMGREQKTETTYQDRVIDIDIILYDDLVYESEELRIPHPHCRQRPFVWEPLQEIL